MSDMSERVAITFKTITQLWGYAQAFKATDIEIITPGMILICDCSDRDIAMLPQYGGKIINEIPIQRQVSSNKN